MAKTWIVEVSRSRRCESETYTYAVQAETDEEARALALAAARKTNTGWSVDAIKEFSFDQAPVVEVGWAYWES